MSLNQYSWTESARRLDELIAIITQAMNHWAGQSLEVLDRGRNVQPRDPDGCP